MPETSRETLHLNCWKKRLEEPLLARRSAQTVINRYALCSLSATACARARRKPLCCLLLLSCSGWLGWPLADWTSFTGSSSSRPVRLGLADPWSALLQQRVVGLESLQHNVLRAVELVLDSSRMTCSDRWRREAPSPKGQVLADELAGPRLQTGPGRNSISAGSGLRRGLQSSAVWHTTEACTHA